MLGISVRRGHEAPPTTKGEVDVAKLFFDKFSKRVSGVEEGLKELSAEVEKLKLSTDRSQISDLVLLERLQQAEGMLEESLSWIKNLAYLVSQSKRERGVSGTPPAERGIEEPRPTSVEAARRVPVPVRTLVTPSGEGESLPSITTPTELQVLSLLAEQAPKSAPEIGRLVSRSREHTARLMKKLYQEGYVRRDHSRIPYRYALVDRVKQSFKKDEKRVEEEEALAAPQT